MTAGEILAAVVLSVAIIWAWSQVVGFFLTVIAAAARAYWRTRVEFRGPTVEDVLTDPRGVGPYLDPAGNVSTTASRQDPDPLDNLIREALAPPNHINCRCSISHSVGYGSGRPRRRLQLVERIALDVGEDAPVFCSWPAGRQTITLPTRGGDPMILVRTNECVLDDGTDRLAVVYRQQPENGKAE